MVNALVTLCMIFLFLITGQIIEFIKRLLMFIIDCLLKLLDLFGLHVRRREYRIRVSKEFKNTFKEIKIVKKSKLNTKLKPSINIFALVTFLLSVALIVIDLDVVSNGAITTWLYTSTFFNKIVSSQQSMNVTFTAVFFSIMSFSLSKLISLWRETKEIRKTRRQIRARNKAFRIASSKELLDAAKIRDAERYEQLKKQSEDKEC